MDTLGLLLVIALIAVAPVVFLYPMWRRVEGHGSRSKLILFLPAIAGALWLGLAVSLAAVEIKGASLSNLVVELPIVVVASAIIVVARLRLFEATSMSQSRADATAIAAVVVLVALVRALIPELGE